MNYNFNINKSDGTWIATLIEVDLLCSHPDNIVETITAESFEELQRLLSGFVEKTNQNI